MTAAALKRRLEARPFGSFGLRTADGNLLPISHPEFISIDPVEERTVIVWDGEGGAWTIDLELVTELKTAQQ